MPKPACAPHLKGNTLLEELERSGLGEKALWRERYSDKLTYNAYHSRVWNARQKTNTAKTDVIDIKPAPLVVYSRPPSLSDLDDTRRWAADLQALTSSKRYVTVMHACDIHAPYAHKPTMEALFQLTRLVQPDVIVRGSDEDDLPTISVFAERDNDAPDIGDFLDVMQETRHYHTRRFQDAASKALQVNIEGNHGWPRMGKWLNKNAKQGATSLTRRYIENIRAGGDVAFIGFKESVLIHPALLVMHGKKWGDYAPKQTLQLRAMGVNIMAGHSHKPGEFTTVQANGKPVSCVISGCLCNVNPHYAPLDDDQYTTWQNGTAVGFLDTLTGIVNFRNVTFNHADDVTWFVWGGKVYRYSGQPDGEPTIEHFISAFEAAGTDGLYG